MNETLSDLDPRNEELWTLAEGLYSGQLTPEQRDRLETLIAQDDAVAMFCAGYANMHAMLRWRFRPIEPEVTSIPETLSADMPEPSENVPATTADPVRSQRAIPLLFGNAFQGTIGFFSQEVPFSILIATFITGLGLWFGSLVHVTHHEQFAGPGPDVRQPSPLPRVVEHRNAKYVACVANMVDCKGQIKGAGIRDQGLETVRNHRLLIAVGDKFVLTSGLLELNYDTGAKVILQGPVTYEVDSRDGGFLSVGKLTARLEKKGSEVRGQVSGKVVSGQWPVASVEEAKSRNPEISKSQISNPQSLIPHPLFAVRTPTATVTDLGTEFGVEVRESGVTSAYVFRGIVEVQVSGMNGRRGQAVRLIENEAVQVDASSNKEPFVRPVAIKNDVFIRSEQLAEIVQQRQSKTVRYRTLEWPVLHKTLVVWVSLDQLDQKGVGVMSLLDMPEWDGIVYDELNPRKWMGGSHGYQRTQKEQASYPAETARPDELVQIAAVYEWTTVTLYRNGQKYASFDAGDRHVYKKDMMLLIGKRHLPMFEGHELPTLAGKVEEARFYDYAMTPEGIASLKLGESSQIPPVGLWTFDDGTARDSTGHFPEGKLHGNAKIADGKLILDGRDSYLLIPAAMAPTQKASDGAASQTLSTPKHKEETNVAK